MVARLRLKDLVALGRARCVEVRAGRRVEEAEHILGVRSFVGSGANHALKAVARLRLENLVEFVHARGEEVVACLGVEEAVHRVQVLRGCQVSEQSMRFVLHARREVDTAGIAARPCIAGLKSPEVADDDRVSLVVEKLAQEVVVAGIEGVDGAVAEVPDEKVVGELPKAGRSDRIAKPQGESSGPPEATRCSRWP